MKARFAMDKHQVGDINLTISMTMPVQDWRDLLDKLDDSQWPMNDVWSVITAGLREIDGLETTLIEGKDAPV